MIRSMGFVAGGRRRRRCRQVELLTGADEASAGFADLPAKDLAWSHLKTFQGNPQTKRIEGLFIQKSSQVTCDQHGAPAAESVLLAYASSQADKSTAGRQHEEQNIRVGLWRRSSFLRRCQKACPFSQRTSKQSRRRRHRAACVIPGFFVVPAAAKPAARRVLRDATSSLHLQRIRQGGQVRAAVAGSGPCRSDAGNNAHSNYR